MNHQFFYIILILFCGFSPSKLFSEERSELLYRHTIHEYHQLLSQKKQIPEEIWLQLVRDFKHIEKNFPTSPQAPQSLLQIAQIYRILYQTTLNKTHINRSLRTLRQLIEIYPETPLADDSQFMIGKIFEEDKKEMTLALLEYNKVLLYNGDQKTKATQKIRELQKRKLPSYQLLNIPKTAPQFGGRHQGGISIDQSRALPKARILSVRYWATAKWSRIVINSSRPIPFLHGNLPSNVSQTSKEFRHRYFVDMLDSRSTPKIIASLEEKNRLIHEVDIQILNPRITRLAFSSDNPVSVKVFDYEVSGQNFITLEILPEKVAPPFLSPNGMQQQNTDPAFTKGTIKRIIIDPGHGGHDPGASGFGIHEKDIVLAVGRDLKKTIEKNTHLKVFLTRNTDRFLSLEARSAFARQHKGDLFISLHVNAHPAQEARGIESYFLDVTDDQSSIKLAERENSMSDQGLQNFNMILRDLLTLSQSSQSSRLTHAIHARLLTNIRTDFHIDTRNLGVKEAPFLILLGVGMPAALLEISFITNPEENQRLRETKYRESISKGIFQGIQDYILQQNQG
ncbi:MAG: N-acetylmuramoyl-L-alanine amidase [SAR324 cluster bacterium]|nr:N-acetylmuramoyl-L-alanine amidase [SAR324 cluster bacterium]